jgi:hypothetical protein
VAFSSIEIGPFGRLFVVRVSSFKYVPRHELVRISRAEMPSDFAPVGVLRTWGMCPAYRSSTDAASSGILGPVHRSVR